MPDHRFVSGSNCASRRPSAGWMLGSAALLLLTVACGGGGGSPSGGTSTPASTPEPTPEPTPTPNPQFGYGCGAGDGPGDPFGQCPRTQPSFMAEVHAAIDQLGAEEPDVFDKGDQRGGGGWRILKLGRYYTGVVENLEAMGLCATFDGEELAVKANNDFNDQYDIELATGHVYRGDNSYASTCTPAWFPKAQPVPGSTPGCSLPGSRELACGREPTSRFLDLVDAAIVQLIEERPELFDPSDPAPGTDFPRVLNVDAYVQGLVDIVQSQGYCAIWDGEELAVKESNDFNDQIDVLLSSNHVWRGFGTYRSTCYPAAF